MRSLHPTRPIIVVAALPEIARMGVKAKHPQAISNHANNSVALNVQTPDAADVHTLLRDTLVLLSIQLASPSI